MDSIVDPFRSLPGQSIPNRPEAAAAKPEAKETGQGSIRGYVQTVRDAITGLGEKPRQAPLIDRSPAARRARSEAARAAIARMRSLRNEPDEDDGEFFRALDEANPGRFELARFYADGPDPA